MISTNRFVRGANFSGEAAQAGAGRNAERQAVLDTLERYLEAMRAGDADAWEELLIGNATAWRISLRAHGEPRILMRTLRDMIEMLRQRWIDRVEYLVGAEVRIEGPMATVWSPYEMWVDGSLRHSGTNAMQMLKIDGHWRIANAMWTVEGEDDASPAER